MFAIIETGGKQYKVKSGDIIKVEKLELGIGEFHLLDKVLLLSQEGKVTLGQPFVENAKIKTEIVAQARAKKIKIIKFRRRKHHMKHQGHRQYYTALKVVGLA